MACTGDMRSCQVSARSASRVLADRGPAPCRCCLVCSGVLRVNPAALDAACSNMERAYPEEAELRVQEAAGALGGRFRQL